MAEFNRERKFTTGADRSSDIGKPNPERALSALVLARFSKYMLEHNGTATPPRREDQWQLGFPLDSFMESGWRHFTAWWQLHRGFPAVDEKGNPVDLEEALCGLYFNVQGYLHQILLEKLKVSNPDAYTKVMAELERKNKK